MVTLLHAFPQLLSGLAATIALSLVTLFIGTVLGFFFGIARALRIRILAEAIGLLIHVVRGTPFLVQLYIVYFVLPRTGLSIFDMSAATAAVIALSIYTSTYAAEITRSAMEAVPLGQIEAAKALGLTLRQRLSLVVLPQARRLMVPPLGGLYVIIVKSTSIVSVVGIGELVRAGDVIAMRAPRDLFFVYGAVALLYFAYCFPLLRLARWLELRSGRHLPIS
ncbi:amino acid ABC transporter permease [Labrys okinawensis]|uniref:amino acid ABC transporter permease n=1 Tax=Labrys okinawensis TaxID=346911 RepID=UPI0039BC28AC